MLLASSIAVIPRHQAAHDHMPQQQALVVPHTLEIKSILTTSPASPVKSTARFWYSVACLARLLVSSEPAMLYKLLRSWHVCRNAIFFIRRDSKRCSRGKFPKLHPAQPAALRYNWLHYGIRLCYVTVDDEYNRIGCLM